MKNLVIFCDGTWNKADQAVDGVLCPTNVVRMGYRVANRNGDVPQIVYYDQGVGTGNKLDKLVGGAVGEGLKENVFQAYRFLVSNYESGDQIFLIGFSRGAYTARSVAGMIRKCGILKREVVEKYLEAIALYRHRAIHPDDSTAVTFRIENAVDGSQPTPIQMVAVWDTVGALGVPDVWFGGFDAKKMNFFDVTLSGIVKHAYHAVAIDEERGKFEPTLWHGRPKPGQILEQVWFCGVHSDVGGGYKVHQLSDIALEWLIERAGRAGLAFDSKVMASHPYTSNPLGMLHKSRTGMYRLMKRYRRPIGVMKEGGQVVLDPTQSLHPSVLERWDNDAGYRPPELRAYFLRKGDHRGEAP
ncbi:MAG: DUF2235 domain-containing protein [Nitrospirota bacterium]|nr:DUF2235 domain-containing protein [Nitrospirota bacterium]